MVNETYISRHEFLFPFSWFFVEKSKYNHRGYSHEMEAHLLQELKGWVSVVDTPASFQKYNEKVYFYPAVQPVLYPNTKNNLVKIYKRKQQMSDYIEIESLKGTYRLDLVQITLKLYRTGIGILDFVLINKNYEEEEAITAINNLSKSIYPYRLPLKEAQEDFFPKSIRLLLGESRVEEQFQKLTKEGDYELNQCIQHMLGESFTTPQASRRAKRHTQLEYVPIMNNRMFVVCVYANEKLYKALKERRVDQDRMNRLMNFSYKVKGAQIDYIDLPYITYGIGRFTMVGVHSPTHKVHFYNQLVTLAMVQRSSVLHFSNQMAFVSSLSKQELIDAIRAMYEIYIQFITRIYFNEVTVEVEGTRIYNALMEQLQVEKELKQLDFEMRETHEYAILIEKQQAKNRVDFLTIVGAALVIPTFVTGFFGMNVLQDKFLDWWQHKEIALWFNTYVVIPVLVVMICYTWGNQKSLWGRIKQGLMILILLVGIGISKLFGCGLTP